MVIIGIDVHRNLSQIAAVCRETGEVILELKVPTEPQTIRDIVEGIKGSKVVVFEEGPSSALLYDALKDVADEVISCDPSHNALIARSEDANDEKDALRLITLASANSLKAVHVPAEPFRTLRSLTNHDFNLMRTATQQMNRIKALCRRNGIAYHGKGIYRKAGRGQLLNNLKNKSLAFQAESMYRHLDLARIERVKTKREISRIAGTIPSVKRLRTIPGLGPYTSAVLAAWIEDPGRFKSRSALSSYGGLGIGQSVTAWKQVGRARASKRGQKRLKYALFIAARAAVSGNNAISRNYFAHIENGWSDRKAIRETARKILLTACMLWKKGGVYNDKKVIPVKAAGK